MAVDPALIAAVADALGRGQIPGLGSAQNDTFYATDNVDATHPLNIRYVIPSNCQRIIAARLSFHLAPFRAYVSAVNTTTSSTSAHYHTWVQGGTSRTLAFTLGMDVSGNPGMSGSTPPPFGFQTATETPAAGAQFSTFSTIDSNGSGHSHTITPTLSYGVFEGATAAGVTIKFDGTDKTTALGGSWSADKVEMDVLQYIQQKPDRTYHTISLTPSGLGRIEAHLRLNYFANAGINA